ncbi:MAG: sulfate transporter CysZ [Gammaproteobacteria bacterium]|nr:sulfate transporter CysZ [Gammaproteobacteria bacterium]
MNNNPFTGAAYFFRGLKMLGHPALRKFVVIPLVLNIGFFALLTYFAYGAVNEFVTYMMDSLPSWLQWLEIILMVLFVGVILIFVYFTFSIFANLFAAPFNSVLAEATEELLIGGSITETSVSDSFTQIIPAIKDEIGKLTYTLTRSIPFLVLFFIPGVNFIASIAWFFMSAWILALEYNDYPMGNNNKLFVEQRNIASQRRWLNLGFGSAISVLTMIPFVNFLVIPSAVVGATIMYVENFQDENLQTD